MIKQLLPIACASYLAAAFPAYAQKQSPYDPSSHDGCGGDSCASIAYDLGYRDGYEGHSHTAKLLLQNNPQYDAGFSEGEMDKMVEEETQTADQQAREERPTAQRQAQDHQTYLGPDGRGLLSHALDAENGLMDRDIAKERNLQ
jgi:hypothetical protein